MAREILGGFGPDSSQPQASPVGCGGVLPGETKDVMNYQAPYGPKNIMDAKSPGLHGKNQGTKNGPDKAGAESGRPGLGGTVMGCGSQGRF